MYAEQYKETYEKHILLKIVQSLVDVLFPLQHIFHGTVLAAGAYVCIAWH